MPEQLLFGRRVMAQMQKVAVERNLKLDNASDVTAIHRLSFGCWGAAADKYFADIFLYVFSGEQLRQTNWFSLKRFKSETILFT